MNTKYLAQALNISISELSTITGYSRQTLYRLIDHRHPVNKRRFDTAVKSLILHSDIITEKEIGEAKQRERARMRAIESLKNEVTYIV
ncbi:MAG: hypothetical protein E7L17_14470 [Clostridium sp.]|uniref:hypothetical protein n=1 Tax=Clostridium sp. TaxID=1506 RepID=UPI00290FB38F|nr:hypothetical protein [Clostridium sp.]MDU7339304.1 hypothetical protein [Clostridium sp.]